MVDQHGTMARAMLAVGQTFIVVIVYAVLFLTWLLTYPVRPVRRRIVKLQLRLLKGGK